MKNFFILIAAFSMISFSAFSQKNPPENVKKEFSKKYAKAHSVKWSREETDKWEAEFKMDRKKISASFDNLGRWLNSETVILKKDLPPAVLNTLDKDYKGFKKGVTEVFESPEIKGFEMELKKGASKLEVIFDNTGKVFKKTEVKKGDEKD